MNPTDPVGGALPDGEPVAAPCDHGVVTPSRPYGWASDRLGPRVHHDRYGTDSAIGMNITEMFSDMPLVSVLMFQQAALDKHPEDLVDELLQRAHGLT